MNNNKSKWPAKTPTNIIIRMPNWLGDLVMATPVLHDVRRMWPEARITAMCQSNVAGLLKHDPNINEVFSYKRPNGWIPRQQHWEIIQQLRYGKYDLGILLTNSFSSAWWYWLGNVKNRLGYAGNARSFLLNKSPAFPENKEKQHLVITYKMLLEPLGILLSDSPPTLYLTNEEMNNARTILETHGVVIGKNKIVGINPGAAFGSAKCWLPDRFQGVTKRLLEDPNLVVVYFGDPAGAPLVNDICKEFPERVINLAGRTTLRELLALIKLCTVFLTNDSGPMHIAAALKVPLVAIFGSTSDVKTGPYGGGKVIHKRVECSPCYKRVCPIDFRCMKRIEVDEVYEALRERL
jgi:heptosyltransferase-2